MWLWILLIIALIAAAFIFTASWMLVKLVITPERSSLEEVEQLEIERGNFAPGEMAAMVPDEEGSIIARDGVRLDYCWYRAAEPTDKVCILAHGFWVRRESELKYARIYMQRGYDVLLYHQRNSGTSEGKYCTMGYLERHDLAALVALARRDKATPKSRVPLACMGIPWAAQRCFCVALGKTRRALWLRTARLPLCTISLCITSAP